MLAAARSLARTTFVVPLLALPLGLIGCAGPGSYGGATYQEDRAMRVAHIAGSALSVVNANGAVTAHADATMASDEVQIDARIYANDAERLAFARLHADREGDGSLHVWVEWPAPGRQHNEGASIRVVLPDAEGLSIRTSNGSVKAEGFRGPADLTTSNGAVAVHEHRGDVVLSTTNGSVRAERVLGPVDIATSNGSVVVEEVAGPVLVETTNASVTVYTDHQNPGPVRVRTTNGRIELSLSEAFRGFLRLGTTNGSIRAADIGSARLIETSRNYTELQFGDDTAVSAAKTTNGTIRVTTH